MAAIIEKNELNSIIQKYIKEIKDILEDDFEEAVIYGSYASGEYSEESDIDIVIFTSRKTEDFYLLINKISEITFEYNVKYDITLSPVFQNTNIFNRMMKVVPYVQSIKMEGILIR